MEIQLKVDRPASGLDSSDDESVHSVERMRGQPDDWTPPGGIRYMELEEREMLRECSNSTEFIAWS